MGSITQIQLNFILFLQGLGEWLKSPMLFFSFLGSEYFYLVVLPFLYWCVDARLGLQFAAMTVVGNFASSSLKLIFQSPRPFWVDARIQPLTTETSFGMPSGHATHAASTWGVLGGFFKKRWVVIAISVIVFLIGFSRLYLGVHIPSQVLAGWLVGSLLLYLMFRLSKPLTQWLLKFPLTGQIGIIFLAAGIMAGALIFLTLPLQGRQYPSEWVSLGSRPLNGEPFNPIDLEGAFTLAGTWFGGFAGAAWYYHRYGLLSTIGSPLQKALRFLLGVVVLFALWYGLGEIFPRTADAAAYLLRFVRYSLLGLWLTVGAPWIFKKLNLLSVSPRK